MRLYYGSCSVEAMRVDDAIVLHGLVGEGNVCDLLQLFRSAKETALDMPVYLSVDFDNPRIEQLMNVYKRFGAVPKAIVLEVK